MGLNVADRLLTVVVTATLTSAAWIVVGSMTVERVGSGATAPEKPADTKQPVVSSIAASGEAVWAEAAGELLIPIENVGADQLVDSYADERGAGSRVHRAIDIMSPAGTPVIAAAAGTVESLFRSDDGGNTIYIRSGGGRTIYYYAHLQGYASGLKEGDRVRRGERIGTVGSTGNADPAAPHLHFAIVRTRPESNWWDEGASVNPYPLLGGK